ncbi:serine/arginine repetitive matrix protein 1-like isoform X2 [Eriocheir sinensis]|uniref:serine/arginine repetitive matrix protein 1-like isoform X2 n=1 Tax=Eriocheir sinensis TaxID=95602 RepID=UPI0021C8C0DA|nr:serine/arginine repetitive matrix protein 1-like isoform X2 [Eriocheir sinensis]
MRRRREAVMGEGEGGEERVEEVTEKSDAEENTERSEVQEESHMEVHAGGETAEEGTTAGEDSRSLNTVSGVEEGRGHRGVMEGSRPAKVIITARRGHPMEDTHALDRNLPPPRLMDAQHAPPAYPHSDYRVNYPGAKLRVSAPRPSHLTPHGADQAVRRRDEPHSISFGSSSLSQSTYHHPQQHQQHHHPQQRHQREPITYYQVGGASPSPGGNPQPAPRPHAHPGETLRPPGPSHGHLQPPPPHIRPPPAPQQPQQPYAPPHQHHEHESNAPEFRPSKLLPPTGRPSPVTIAATTRATTHFPYTRPSEVRHTTHTKRLQTSAPRRPTQPRRPSPPPRRPSPPPRRPSPPPRGPSPSPPRLPSPSPPPPPARRGHVVNAPSPAFTVLAAGDDATASLTPLATLTKSGVRTEIGHRAGSVTRGRDTPTRPHRRPAAGRGTRPGGGGGGGGAGGGRYSFVSGEVYTPPPIPQRPPPPPHQHKPFLRITTRRPFGQELAVIPYKESYSTFEPKYVKDSIAEMEFEPKTMPAPPPPHAPPAAVHWFLMPVQGWFVLSIILAALVVVLGVGSAILYSSLRKQKRKMKRLTGGPAVVLPPCVDPIKHEACGCRALAPLVRSHTLLSRASIMTSRASQRSLRSLSLPRHQMAVPSPQTQARTGGGMRSLPASSQNEKERDTTFDSITTTNTHLEVEDAPPPLAPKKSSLSGMQDSKGDGGRESRMGLDSRGGGGRDSRMGLDSRGDHGGRESRMGMESRGGGRDSRMGAYDGRHGSGAPPPTDAYGRGGQHRFSMSPDVQLTTIYPPPRRFEL